MSVGAIALYGAVILTCIAAASAAANRTDRNGDRLHWQSVGFIFASLAIFRAFDGEEFVRGRARGLINEIGSYADRATFQVPLALIAFVLGLLVIWIFARQWRALRTGGRGRLVLTSRFALLALLPLYALRLISLHQTDWLLYSGPIRINWLLEFAISTAVGGAAAMYFKLARKRAVRRPTPDENY